MNSRAVFQTVFNTFAKIGLATAVVATAMIQSASANPWGGNCNAEYQGMLHVGGGMQLTVLVEPARRDRPDRGRGRDRHHPSYPGDEWGPDIGQTPVYVTVYSYRGTDKFQGVCETYRDGSSLVIARGTNGGQFQVTRNGRVEGRLYHARFVGHKNGASPIPPRPTPPRPVPPPPYPHPVPGPQDPYCNGVISGNWDFGHGRVHWLTIRVNSRGGQYISADFDSSAGRWAATGQCVMQRNGTVGMSFHRADGRRDSITIDHFGNVRGVISGAPFAGRRN